MNHAIVNLVLLAIVALPNDGASADEPKGNGAADNPALITRGAVIYKRFCSLCHGKNLEGQPNWRERNAAGKMPAPPHDETGHTWHHPDHILFGIIKHGLVPPYAPRNYETDMPAWGSTLKDEDIRAVLAFLKSRWPERERRFQEKVTQDARRP